MLIDGGEAREHRFLGYWRDVGTVDSYWSAHMELVDAPPFEFDDEDWPILSAGHRHPPARVRSSATVADSLLSGGCDVAGRVERSILSPGAAVEKGARVDRAVLLPGAVVRAGAVVRRTILDAGVTVGSDCQVGGARGGVTLIGGAMTLRKGTTVAAGEHRPHRRRTDGD